MAGKGDAEVDPRFDPLFQRGYDPGKHRTRRTPRVEERAEGSRLETAPENPPENPPDRPDDVVPAPGSSVGIYSATSPDSNDEQLEHELPRRNPFRVLLLLSSIVALAAAGALLWNRLSSDPYYYGSPGTDIAALFADSIVQALLPALTTGGIIGIALWLGLGALRRRDRD